MASDFGVSGRKQETESVTAKPHVTAQPQETRNQVCHREAPQRLAVAGIAEDGGEAGEVVQTGGLRGVG
jgi:hypothetical protein